MSENIQWRIIDNRKDINGEFGLCQNGHECFISSYLSFPIGKKAIVRCEKCGVEILRYAKFKIIVEEIDSDEDILKEIIAQYNKFEKVQSIVRHHDYEAQITIRVYLSIDQYDDKLMDQLLDCEWDIRKKFFNIIFDFLYIPIMIKKYHFSIGLVLFDREDKDGK